MIIRAVDTIEFGFFIKDYKKYYDAILEELKEIKALGRNLKENQNVEYNGVSMEVERGGTRFYAYILKSDDFTMLIADQQTQNLPDIKVTLRSDYLWSYGYQEAYEKFLSWFSYFPGIIERKILSRLDICVDTDQIDFNDIDKDKFITRAGNVTDRSNRKNNNRRETLEYGSRKTLFARIYDKTVEIKKSYKKWMEKIWSDNGWDNISCVWRIEYELHRSVLKELNLYEVEDVKENEDRLWNYLTNRWLRLDDPRWQEIAKTEKPIIDPMVRNKVLKGDLSRITMQTNGLILSLGAYGQFKTIDEALHYLKHNLLFKLKKEGTTYEKETKKRNDKLIRSRLRQDDKKSTGV
jgi:hypothetical protein